MVYKQQAQPIVSELSNHIYGVLRTSKVGAYKAKTPRLTQDRRKAKRNRKR